MNQNLSNEDELQKAIDDITNNTSNSMPANSGIDANLMANSAPVAPEVSQTSAMNMQMPDPIDNPVMPAAPDFVAPEPVMATAQKVDDKPIGGLADMPTVESNPVMEPVSAPKPIEPVKPEMKQPEEQDEQDEPEELAEPKPEVFADGKMSDVKEKALRDLMPLINKMNINSDQKVKILFDGMETLGDKSIADELYEAISQIGDDNTKGEALLKLVEKLD